MLDMLWNNLTAISAVLGALALAFVSPFGSKVIERIFARRPIFSVVSPVVGPDLLIIVQPANSAARKRRPLGLSVRGINVPDLGELQIDKRPDKQSFGWAFDLSTIENISEILKDGEDYSFRFFFDADYPSAPATIRYKQALFSVQHSSLVKLTPVRVSQGTDLIAAIRPNSKLLAGFQETKIGRAFPLSTPNSKWVSVHDGKELHIVNVANVEWVGGGARVLAEPRYAWVLNFRKCQSLAIRNFVFGHTEAGYCRGGVLRFDSCANIIIEGCELFGSGTYGIELVNCQHIEIVDSKIRDCTYGIMNLDNVSDVAVRNCEFTENLDFDLFDIRNKASQVMIKNCTFVKNKSIYKFFEFDDEARSDLFFVNDCKFERNAYSEFTNYPGAFNYGENEHIGDAVGKPGWRLDDPKLWAPRRLA